MKQTSVEQPLMLQFSTQRTLGSWLIRKFTWSDYSHVDIVLPDGRLLGAMSDGVAIREPYPCDRVARYKLDIPMISHDLAKIFAEDQLGKDYDWPAIFGMIIRNNWQQPDRWFCSELVAWAFQQAGSPLINDQGHRITPRDLLLSPFLIPVSE